MPRYNPAQIEPKWQQYWEEHQTFKTPQLPQGEKVYILDMFPYPSGDGLHVGHPEGYTATDIVARYKRMQGCSVMHPMGFDAFGLPAEQHAKKTGTHPRITTEKNIATFRRQLKMLGFSYDWDREIATTNLAYFRWTQWIFLQLYDTWFDPKQARGRPIGELPIPEDVKEQGEIAVRRYQDEHRLAYQQEAPVNWCPALGTVLANEEVIGGVSERGGHPVVRKPLRQWMLRITAYAQRLEDDLDQLDWSDGIKALQRNWIGRSTGAEVDFYIGTTRIETTDENPTEFISWQERRKETGFPSKSQSDVLRVYTTRPDTLFGATYMVIAPEHPLVERLTIPKNMESVHQYCETASRKSDLDRTDLAKDKTGVFTGSYAINPVNGKPVPIWIADYVLISYGTGAIMAVPAHDTRDFEFAQQFQLPIVPVVDPRKNVAPERREAILHGKEAFAEHGTVVNSDKFDGLSTTEFKKRIIDDLGSGGLGCKAVNYKLRDWLFSRQHFWGEPFPLLRELDENGGPTGLVRPVKEEDLPVDLPDLEGFQPQDSADPPLEQASQQWLYPVIKGVKYKRETNTMPQWAGSCWYYLRFLDPENSQTLVDPKIEKAWMPVDLYVGGAEHAVLHLLYARFWHKVLYDRGVISTPEPFKKLVNQGMILGDMEITGYQDEAANWVSVAEVTSNATGQRILRSSGEVLQPVQLQQDQAVKKGDAFVLADNHAIALESRAHKMSKSRGNVVNPDEVVAEYGADSLRLYEMFMGPLEAKKPWSMDGVSGVRGFLDRVWRMMVDVHEEQNKLNPAVQNKSLSAEQDRILHRTIRDVTQDLERLSFNTAIAKMMEFTNFFLKEDPRPKLAMENFVLLLSPLAPHIAEELWQILGHTDTLAMEQWPSYSENKIRQNNIEVPVQINGKLRGRITVATQTDSKGLEQAARDDHRIAELLDGKQVVKVIAIPNRMVNFVVKG